MTLSHRSSSVTPQRSILLAAGIVLALAANNAGANQVYKACGKKWAKKAAKLPQEKLAWMLAKSSAEAVRDLDRDGRDDRILMTSTPSFRTCDVAKDWDQKETTVRIELGNGKVKLYHWINGLMVNGLKLHPTTGRMLVTGTDAQGQATSKWVDYGPVQPAANETLLAAANRPAAPPGSTKK